MKNSQLPIYLILPAHNEEKNLEQVLLDYTSHFTGLDSRFHVVVNFSSDKTLEIAKRCAAHDSRIILTDIKEKVGKGGAIIYGLTKWPENLDYGGFVDTDGAVTPQEFEKLVPEITGRDVVISSRWISGSNMLIKQSIFRRLLSRMFNLAIRLLYGFPYSDTQCGAKLMTRSAYSEIAGELTEKSFAFDIQLLWLSKKHKLKVSEVPITWVDVPHSSVKPFQMALPMLKTLLRIRFR